MSTRPFPFRHHEFVSLSEAMQASRGGGSGCGVGGARVGRWRAKLVCVCVCVCVCIYISICKMVVSFPGSNADFTRWPYFSKNV